MFKLLIKCRPCNSDISSLCQSNAFSSSGKVQVTKPKIKRFAIMHCRNFSVQGGQRALGHAHVNLEYIFQIHKRVK